MADICIVGAGAIAKEYAKVLSSLNKDYVVIGRGELSAGHFKRETGHPVVTGGIEKYLQEIPESQYPTHAIVAVDIPQLAEVTVALMKRNIPNILVEKPGFANVEDLSILKKNGEASVSKVLIAYNRRFFSSVIEAEKMIKEDGGVLSFHFEFTEWTKSVMALPRPQPILDNWFYANSSHVVDLAFYLGGFPVSLSSYTSGKLDWYKHAIFVGSGKTDRDALFSYCANWDAPGRWGVEIMTRAHRFYLKPMELLQIQNLNSIAITQVEIDDSLDKDFKPGFYLQTKSFIENDTARFCTLQEQIVHTEKWYSLIDGE